MFHTIYLRCDMFRKAERCSIGKFPHGGNSPLFAEVDFHSRIARLALFPGLRRHKLQRRNYPLIPKRPGMRAVAFLILELKIRVRNLASEGLILLIKEVGRAASGIDSGLRLVLGECSQKV